MAMLRLTGYLRARLGRRIALLFFLCALVPIVAFSLVTLVHVRGQLVDQSRERLRLLGKESGQALLYRLHAASLEAARWVDGGDDAPLPTWFDGVAVVHEPEGPSTTIVGVPIPTPTEASARDHLRTGGALVRVSERRVLLARAPASEPGPSRFGPGEPLVWFALDEGYVDGRHAPWAGEQERSPLPAGVEPCLIGPEGPVTSCPDALLAALSRGDAEPGSDARHFTWSEDGEARFAARRPVFLRAAFMAPNWELVLSESKTRAMAPVHGFQRTFLLATLLSLLVVPFASQVQIRRNLEPLSRLEEGTRRLAGREFDSRVDIRSGDEFEELAGSFNRMAERLGRQFGALRTANEIDRAILGELRTDAILERVLERAPEVLPSAELVVLTADPDGTVRSHFSTAALGPTRPSLGRSPGELLKLAASCSDEPTLVSDRDGGETVWTVCPVRVEGDVPAAILIGTRDVPSDEDREHASQMADRLAVALANARLVDALDRLNVETITAFARAIDAKSTWTAGHSERVTEMALRIGRELELPRDRLEVLRRGALLHDIGKIGVPEEILDKAGSLTDEEFELMRAHTTMGASILAPISGLRDIIPIARHHHERFDGGGYPDRLGGEDIPHLARIVAVADVFDALSSARPYREAMPMARVVEIVIGDSGSAFDPAVVAAFQRVMGLPARGEVA